VTGPNASTSVRPFSVVSLQFFDPRNSVSLQVNQMTKKGKTSDHLSRRTGRHGGGGDRGGGGLDSVKKDVS
jgi:hypothetical protein